MKVHSILNEKVGESTPASFLIRKLGEMGFKLLGVHEPEAEHYGFVCYINALPKNYRDLFERIRQLVRATKWEVTASGNYYDGLRSYYHIAADEDPDVSYGTFFMRMEPTYGDPADSSMPVDPDEYSQYYGIEYEKGVFYHITRRKYVPRMLRQGIVPKNGHEITRWRDTEERVYLSTIPDFGSDVVNYENCVDKDMDDQVMLRVDLRGRNDIKYYVDESYSNAVYTYSTIPSQCIEVLEPEDIELAYETRDLLGKIIEKYKLTPRSMSMRDISSAVTAHLMKYVGSRYSSIPKDHVEDVIRQVYDESR